MAILSSRGKFQRIVLRVVYTTRNAYAVPIQAKVEELWGKPVRFASVYSALDRLEERGYVRSWGGRHTRAGISAETVLRNHAGRRNGAAGMGARYLRERRRPVFVMNCGRHS